MPSTPKVFVNVAISVESAKKFDECIEALGLSKTKTIEAAIEALQKTLKRK